MKIYVGNTDRRWYSYLAERNTIAEVNFWRPSGSHHNFRAISPGELFFLRLPKPYSKIAGFGTFTYHSVLPLLMAWEVFGEANGCGTITDLVRLIAEHRNETPDLRTALSWEIGCTILTDIHYYAESDWLDFPFRPGLVQGKSLDILSEDGALIWQHMQTTLERERLSAPYESAESGRFALVSEERATYSSEIVKQRSGQGAFRVMVLDAYGRRCCVTGERTLPVLEAAHIQRYVAPESNSVQNGLALREDIHTLFDRGYVAVDPSYRFIVSGRLRDDFENGREYYKYHGQPIIVPGKSQLAPSTEAIMWHLDNVYIG